MLAQRLLALQYLIDVCGHDHFFIPNNSHHVSLNNKTGVYESSILSRLLFCLKQLSIFIFTEYLNFLPIEFSCIFFLL